VFEFCALPLRLFLLTIFSLDSLTLLVRGTVGALPGEEPAAAVAGEAHNAVAYGFNNLHSGVFRGLERAEEDILELPDPETTPPEQRTALRLLAG
jgi:hypothetical protein